MVASGRIGQGRPTASSIDTGLRHTLTELELTHPGTTPDTLSRHQLPWEARNGKWLPYGSASAGNPDIRRGGARWQCAREAMALGHNGHNPMSDQALNIPKKRFETVFEPIRRAAVDTGVFRPVNHWRKRQGGPTDRTKELARMTRKDLMCLQRYKGDYAPPPVLASIAPLIRYDKSLSP